MDQVWVLSLCLVLFGLFIFILSLKSKKEAEPESISKKSSPSSSSYASYAGRNLEIEEDEVEKMMDRLTRVLYQDEPKKKEVHQEWKKPAIPEKTEVPSPHVKDAESPAETQENLGRGPAHTQPAYQPSHRVQERSAPPAVEKIMDEIEQAVQETVEQDYYARRRQERAAARGRQLPETDSQ